MLVLQRAVEDGPPQLVPAVGADVALGVELGEQVLVRAALDAQPQRRRAGRRLQPDRLDLEHGQPELVAHGLPDRLAAPAGHVDVRGPAPPVDDREHLVRGEEAERGDRDRDPERHAEQHVVGVIDGQVQAGQAEQRRPRRPPRPWRRCGGGPARPGSTRRPSGRWSATATGGDGAEYPPQPPMIGTPYGRGRDSAAVDPLPDDLQEEQAAQEHQQVPPAPERPWSARPPTGRSR